MDDEKYAFEEEVREKKIIARSAHKITVKGGRVMLCSDFMTKKEIQAMSGAVKTYNLSQPMKWAEFKYMPDDLKIAYIKQIRERFGVSDTRISHMLGVSQNSLSNHFKRLGLGLGRGTGNQKSDIEGFQAWCDGKSLVTLDPLEEITECEPVPAPVPEIKTLPVKQEKAKLIPKSGSLNLEGRLEDIFPILTSLLGNEKVSLAVSWEVEFDG